MLQGCISITKIIFKIFWYSGETIQCCRSIPLLIRIRIWLFTYLLLCIKAQLWRGSVTSNRHITCVVFLFHLSRVKRCWTNRFKYFTVLAKIFIRLHKESYGSGSRKFIKKDQDLQHCSNHATFQPVSTNWIMENKIKYYMACWQILLWPLFWRGGSSPASTDQGDLRLSCPAGLLGL